MIFVIYLLTNVITYQFSHAIYHLTDSWQKRRKNRAAGLVRQAGLTI